MKTARGLFGLGAIICSTYGMWLVWEPLGLVTAAVWCYGMVDIITVEMHRQEKEKQDGDQD